MEHSLLIWLLPTLALVAGVAIGFLVARLLPNAAPNRTQRQLDESTHFEVTEFLFAYA